MRPRMKLTAGPVTAFTLIELLMVVGIIALLVGLILPTLLRATEATYRAVCLSNVQLVNRACRLYAQDNQGWLPRELRADVEGPDRAPKFQFDAAPHWGSRGYRADAWSGPKDEDPREKEPWYKTNACPAFIEGEGAIEEYGMAIGTNTRYTAVVEDASNRYRNLHYVRHSGEIVLIVENVYAYEPRDFWEDIKPVCRGRMNGALTRNYPRHRKEGLNFGFMDGHAVFLEYEIQYDAGGNIVKENFLADNPWRNAAGNIIKDPRHTE
jgi:prepilin-type processing-associated H-X9-DG protein